MHPGVRARTADSSLPVAHWPSPDSPFPCGWKGAQLVDYAAKLKCDTLLISDLDSFGSLDDSALRDLKKKGMTLQQVKAARPTLDFDGRYGSTTGAWTTDMFLDAVYSSLQEKK